MGGGTSEEHEYVDLGLSVLWATTNIGAASETDYGNYYAWGETETKEAYSWDTYKYGTSQDALTKYTSTDRLTVLENSDDAAYVNWGSDWRMPTRSEFNELVKECSRTYTKKGNVNGILFTSKMDGYTDKSIFLPAAGYYDDSKLTQNSVYAHYWTSTLFDETSSYEFNFYSAPMFISKERYCGLPIRPVRAK